MSDSLPRVAKVFANLMEIDPSTINRETSPANLEEWDSMAHVQIIVGLEKEFGVTINPDDAVDFESVGMICDWIDKKQK